MSEMQANARRNVLVMGGTSGLGLELAKLFQRTGDNVWISGRKNPNQKDLNFFVWDLTENILIREGLARLHGVFHKDNPVDVLIHCPGFFQLGTIDKLTNKAIDQMMCVGLTSAILTIQWIMKQQQKLSGFIAVTSTSQWTPRSEEPVYTAVKAGLGMFANSMADDGRIRKVVVAAPAGMKTAFWDGTSKDTTGMLDPAWVAQIIWWKYITREPAGQEYEDCRYNYIRILRNPDRLETVESR